MNRFPGRMQVMRLVRMTVVAAMLAARSFAAEEGGAEGDASLEMWKWANFLVLAAGIGYLIGKNAGPFFDARSMKIRKDMVEAGEVRNEAEARAAEMDRRLANLQNEIAALREEAQRETRAETERQAQQTASDIAKIQAHAEQEIAAAAKAARSELKRYTAELAVGLAEQKVRARMTPQTEDALVRNFAQDLK
jgi:F-type H+-transporting ATPase subunit b